MYTPTSAAILFIPTNKEAGGAGGYLAYLLPSALFLSRFLLLIKDVISACQTSGLCLSRNNDGGGDANGRRANAALIMHA